MSHKARRSLLSLGLMAGVFASGEALALEASGTTVDVNPATEASGETGMRTLEIKGPVFMGDQITTNGHGQAQILFVDDTKFVVGPNSKVVIDAFVFNPNNTAQKVSISAVKGAFRFITGASAKNVYAIRTPTMTIGVRGTAFDLAVRGGGESTIAMHHGITDLCDAKKQCMEAKEGSVVVAGSGGGFETLTGLARRQKLAAFFPLARAKLNPAFQVTTTINDANGAGPADLTNPMGSPSDSNRDHDTPRQTETHEHEPADDDPPDGRL